MGGKAKLSETVFQPLYTCTVEHVASLDSEEVQRVHLFWPTFMNRNEQSQIRISEVLKENCGLLLPSWWTLRQEKREVILLQLIPKLNFFAILLGGSGPRMLGKIAKFYHFEFWQLPLTKIYFHGNL